MNLLTLFFGIIAVYVATVPIFFDNVEASASPNALAAPDALADAEALPLAFPNGGGDGGGHRGKRNDGGDDISESIRRRVDELYNDPHVRELRRQFAEIVAREREENLRRLIENIRAERERYEKELRERRPNWG
uniref:Venom peptide n=1 Tax=Dasymutilla chiron TaxID=374949 RepID=A0A8T9VRD6_DASCH|nr:venom peptide precursor [Dasymutilla chiron]